jgi:small nuclear ribonucleoprotein (snRNP)-like protein
MSSVTYLLIQLQMENPEPFLQGLHGKVISVQLKWGWELRGILQSKDEYMNLLVIIY